MDRQIGGLRLGTYQMEINKNSGRGVGVGDVPEGT